MPERWNRAAALVVARSIGDEPYLIAALIRYAGRAIAIIALERVLAQGEPPAADLQKMQELLAREIDAPIFLQALRGERGGGNELLTELEKGNVKLSGLMGGPKGSTTWEAWFLDHLPFIIAYGRAEHLRLMTETVEAAKLPSDQQKAAFAAVENKTRTSSALTVRLLMPAVTKVSEADRRTQANLRLRWSASRRNAIGFATSTGPRRSTTWSRTACSRKCRAIRMTASRCVTGLCRAAS